MRDPTLCNQERTVKSTDHVETHTHTQTNNFAKFTNKTPENLSSLILNIKNKKESGGRNCPLSNILTGFWSYIFFRIHDTTIQLEASRFSFPIVRQSACNHSLQESYRTMRVPVSVPRQEQKISTVMLGNIYIYIFFFGGGGGGG